MSDPNRYVGMATYFRGWDRLVRRGLVAAGVFASFPLAIVAGILVATVVNDGRAIVVCFVAWAAAAFVAHWRYNRSPCPRCHRPFNKRSAFQSRVTSRRCAWCGLEKYTPHDGARAPGRSIFAYRRFRRSAAAGNCGYCGYDLRHIDVDKCPECGEAIPPGGVGRAPVG